MNKNAALDLECSEKQEELFLTKWQMLLVTTKRKEKCGQDLIKPLPHPRRLCDHDPLYSQTLPLSSKWSQFSQSMGLAIKIQTGMVFSLFANIKELLNIIFFSY